VALWCISKAVECLPSASVRPNTTFSFWSFARSAWNVLHPEYLSFIDEWLHKLPSDDEEREKDYSTIATLSRWVPSGLYAHLVENENDLATHWSEIANPISLISDYSFLSDIKVPLDPASWLCAVALFSLTWPLSSSRLDFPSVAAEHLLSIVSHSPLRIFLEKAPKIVKTAALESYEERLKASGHTCWQTWEKCGENSIPVLYASAYSTLMNEIPPVVGCGPSSECKVCRIKNDFHSLDIDKLGMGQTSGLVNMLVSRNFI
jgi:hypothetical protein